MPSSKANATSNAPTADGKGICSVTNAPSSQIIAWGSTTGKLYLDDGRLKDSNYRGWLWKFFLRKWAL